VDGVQAVTARDAPPNERRVSRGSRRGRTTSGWHSHPGSGIVAVRSGIVAIYDGDDPTCTPNYVSAGEVFIEEPGHVHFVRNEGTVAYEAYATFVLPVGVPSRTDEASPGNCPF
jgi:hypothetical protein